MTVNRGSGSDTVPISGSQKWRIVAVLSLAVVAAIGALVAIQTYGWDPARPGGDPWVYLAAGERLNDGSQLYAIGPGDRPVSVVPPYWSTPLLAPPPIAVAWRPLALVGEPSMVIWGLACLAVTGSAVAWLVRSPGSLLVLAIVASPVALTALSGNFSALMIGLLLAAWVARDRPIVVGAAIAISVAVKVTPILLIVWLAGTRRWAALVWVAAFLSLIFVVSAAGAPGAWEDWISLVGSSPSPLSIASLTGLPQWVVALALGLIVSGVAASRRDGSTFIVAVIATSLATPAFYFQAIGPLIAVAAPLPRTWTRLDWRSL